MKIIDDIQDDSVYNAILASIQKPNPDRMRVTELIGPPRIKALKIKHWDDITLPATRFLDSIRGNAWHALFADFADDTSVTEEKLWFLAKWKGGVENIYGTPDKITKQGILVDYKTAAVWSFLFTKPEWEQQANIYRLMCEENGIQVNGLENRVYLEGWSRTEAKRNSDYPPSKWRIIKIPMWDQSKTWEFCAQRLAIHRTPGPLPLCTDEERWRRPTTWAVMKKGLVKAKAVFGTDKRPGTMKDAQRYIKENFPLKDEKLYEVVTRPGRCVRCEDYCEVAPFCDQWQRDKPTTEPESEE